MYILSLETSGEITDLSILDTETDRIWDKQLPVLRGIAEVLTLEIEKLIKSVVNSHGHSLQIQDINLIAVGIGPGSYTGTRVGIATAKGLAQGLQIPIIGVNSFDALIEAIDEDHESETIIPLVDARNNRVYFEINGEIGCDDIQNVLGKLQDKNYVFTGSGATANAEIIKEKLGEQSIIEEQDQILSRVIAGIADARFANNQFDDIVNLKPLYINLPNIG